MLKSTSLVYVFMLFVVCAYSSVLVDKEDEKLASEEIQRIDNNIKNKRSDIDSRLMELQAKIDILKAYQSMKAGHGKFDFDSIGKRSFAEQANFMEQGN